MSKRVVDDWQVAVEVEALAADFEAAYIVVGLLLYALRMYFQF